MAGATVEAVADAGAHGGMTEASPVGITVGSALGNAVGQALGHAVVFAVAVDVGGAELVFVRVGLALVSVG